jgi:ferric-dicitrate binding protein FerR (iron transport regulator)
MTPEKQNPALEQAISGIRDESLPEYVVDAAAARVWHRLAAVGLPSALTAPAEHISGCEGFQALFADLRGGRLPESRELLVKDHLRECVACRRAFEGKVISFAPAPAAPASRSYRARWAIAAGIVAAGGLVVWLSISQFGAGPGHAIVQSISGTLYAVSPSGLRVIAAGETLPDGMEIRTARASNAVVVLRDGSRVEARERSEFSADSAGQDLTIHLDRGSVIVQAAKRRSGHLYLATADCRVAVTGTVFSVSAGL